MKWILLLGLGILAIIVNANTVNAAYTEEITVSAIGSNVTACQPPTSMAVTKLSDYEFTIAWTKGTNAENTIVRAAYGRNPTSRTDGFEIYSGNGTSVVHFVNAEFLSEGIYYRAWSDCGSDNYSTTYAEDDSGGSSMTFFALIALCLGLTFASIRSGFPPFKFMAGISWIGLFIYTQMYPPGVVTEGDSAHTAMLVIFIGIGIMVALLGLYQEIERQRDFSSSRDLSSGLEGGLSFKSKKWQFGSGKPEQGKMSGHEELEELNDEYRERLRKAYRRRGRR